MAENPADAIIGIYQRRAADFDADRARSLFEKSWLDRFLTLVPERGSVLDIGCGSGEPIAAYLMGQGRRVTGVDTAPAMIDVCRMRFPAGEWHIADMRGMALGKSFDGIIAWDSFFHLTHDDQRQMFDVFAAHAMPDTALMFTSGPEHGEALGALRNETLYHASLAPAEYRALLDARGFDVIAHTANDPDCGGHTVWLAQKRLY